MNTLNILLNFGLGLITGIAILDFSIEPSLIKFVGIIGTIGLWIFYNRLVNYKPKEKLKSSHYLDSNLYTLLQ